MYGPQGPYVKLPTACRRHLLLLSKALTLKVLGLVPAVTAMLQDYDLAILRSFGVEVSEPAQHVLVHVSQDEPSAFKFCTVVHQRSIVDVVAAYLL